MKNVIIYQWCDFMMNDVLGFYDWSMWKEEIDYEYACFLCQIFNGNECNFTA